MLGEPLLAHPSELPRLQGVGCAGPGEERYCRECDEDAGDKHCGVSSAPLAIGRRSADCRRQEVEGRLQLGNPCELQAQLLFGSRKTPLDRAERMRCRAAAHRVLVGRNWTGRSLH